MMIISTISSCVEERNSINMSNCINWHGTCMKFNVFVLRKM